MALSSQRAWSAFGAVCAQDGGRKLDPGGDENEQGPSESVAAAPLSVRTLAGKQVVVYNWLFTVSGHTNRLKQSSNNVRA